MQRALLLLLRGPQVLPVSSTGDRPHHTKTGLKAYSLRCSLTPRNTNTAGSWERAWPQEMFSNLQQAPN